ncbi:MAG: carotenoid biosynthesis protein [Chloroflexi bacterium]|nr:carotenoid biosynthesis protein [Chloroflexota bacterium]
MRMADPYFFVFELLMLFTFALCLRHAVRAGIAAALQLGAGILFGVLLELATIRQLNAYHYGQFTLMVLDVPLVIGVAWGCMIYSVRGFTNATSLPEWARPVLDALLVLNIDLAIDAVAIRLGMWDWGHGLEWQYLGVPYANFWAWFWVVFSFSAGLRVLVQRPGWIGKYLAPLGAMCIGLGGVLLTNAFIAFWLPRELYEITIAVVLVGALILILALRPRLMRAPDSLMAQVSFISHGYFLAAGLISTVILQPPFLLVVSIVMFAISLYVYHGKRLWRASQIAPNQERA